VKAKDRIHLKLGDLTEMAVDAIVNAANNDLMLGGGVAGTIRQKGGPAIQEECDRVGPIAVGEAAITTGGDLKARYVIHAASMALGGRTTEPNLRSSVRRSLEIAREHELKTVALPAVGTGIAGFPIGRAAEVMLAVAVEHLDQGSTLQEIWFVLFDTDSYAAFQDAYDRL
jgi:O-acetyl-ADP-ribose deacetylase (regulator of RNase III)